MGANQLQQIGTRFCPVCNRMVDTVSIEVTGRRPWFWIFVCLFLGICLAFGFCIFPVSGAFSLLAFGTAIYLAVNPVRRAQKCIYCNTIIA